jgi:hypothetical protein
MSVTLATRECVVVVPAYLTKRGEIVQPWPWNRFEDLYVIDYSKHPSWGSKPMQLAEVVDEIEKRAAKHGWRIYGSGGPEL